MGNILKNNKAIFDKYLFLFSNRRNIKGNPRSLIQDYWLELFSVTEFQDFYLFIY